MSNLKRKRRPTRLEGVAVQIETRKCSKIRALAKEQKRSFAFIVREAIDFYLARQSGEAA